MQTLNAPGGRPAVHLSADLRRWFDARFGAVHISLTDESDMAMAFVVLEAKAPEVSPLPLAESDTK
jgi:holo-[acyl-carrier protein] synthase